MIVVLYSVMKQLVHHITPG